MKRINPKKGPHEDPGWVEVSWDEALTEIADRLQKIKADDPRKLVWHHGHGKYLMGDQFPNAWCAAFGTPNPAEPEPNRSEGLRLSAGPRRWRYGDEPLR